MGAALCAFSSPAFGFCPARTCDRASETCAEDQNGCVTTGELLAWSRSEVTVSVDPGGSARLGITAEQTAQVLARAFDNWHEVACASGQSPGLSLRVADSTAGGMNEADAIVTYVDSGWRYPRSYGAITQLTVDLDTGAITRALVEINSETHALAIDAQAPEIDLEAVLTHEVGHLIGLDHSRVAGSTMVAETRAFGTADLRSLDTDDVAGVCALYPFRTPKPRSSGSDSSCAASAKSPHSASTTTFAYCLLGAAMLRRRARARTRSAR
jgi:predicted Zn-dependent protease